MIYLEVPFEEKDDAKKLGAKWHSERKKWFISDEMNGSLFEKWMPEYETEFSTKAIAPFYIIHSKEKCWKCKDISKVIAFASAGTIEDDDEGETIEENSFTVYSFVSLLPPKLTKFLEDQYKNFYIDFSKTTGTYYYINHCEHCSAILGDFYMHCEPDGAFFPVSEDEARSIELLELKSDGFIPLNGSAGHQIPSLIEEYAKREMYKP